MTPRLTDGFSVTDFVDNGDELVIARTQDCSFIAEANKAEFNQVDERARWSDEVFGNRVASIPMTVLDDLNKKGILRGFHVIDLKGFRQWLNDPDNRVFRTRPGKV